MLKKAARISIGIVLIFLSITGFIFPVIPGFVFLIPGAILLTPDIPFFGRIICWTRKRYPSTQKKMEQIEKICRWMGTDLPDCVK
jgi:uncharacterized membrane protein YbaN (DUF454 family)